MNQAIDASVVTSVRAWEALDSRGRPTVACAVELADGRCGRVVVPSGASTGTYEAVELRDGGPRYGGYGVRKAVANVNDVLGPAVIGRDAADQRDVDTYLRDLDGTDTLSRLGANAVLAVSLAVWSAASDGTISESTQPVGLPLPMFNIISGGAHARGGIDVQDLLVIPIGAQSVADAVEWGWRVRRATDEVASARGLTAGLVADEGGLGPALRKNRDALNLLVDGIQASGLAPGVDVAIAIDVAATQLADDDGYWLRCEDRRLDPQEWLAVLLEWIDAYPICSVEDPFSDDDWESWAELTKAVGDRIQIIGDDLFVTHHARLERGIAEQAANSVLVKPNQVGTVTDAATVVETAHAHGVRTVVSARSGDTEDVWLTDLAVRWQAGQLKVGSLTRSERTAKWNRLLELEADPDIDTALRGWETIQRR